MANFKLRFILFRNPFLLAFTAVPVVFQLITLPLIPESPKYSLIVKNRVEQAEEDLKKLRGKDDVSFLAKNYGFKK